MGSRPEHHRARPWQDQCCGITKGSVWDRTRRRCVRAATKRVAGAEYCTLHARKYSKREEVLALLCAENVEPWDVARRTGVTETLVRELFVEAMDTKLAVRKAIAEFRAAS